MTDVATGKHLSREALLGPGVAALIPCFNAGDRLRGVVDRLRPLVETILVVDDGSTDGAVDAVADDVAEVIRFDTNRGKGHALLAGFEAALKRPEVICVVTLDADGQHDPAEIPRLIEVFHAEEADLVIGARTFEGHSVPWRSWFGNTLTALLIRLALGRRISDTQSGFRVHSRRFVEGVVATVPGGRYDTEMGIVLNAVREDYRLVTVPIRTIYEAGNPTSHFHKLRDSWLIYRRLFGALRKSRSGGAAQR